MDALSSLPDDTDISPDFIIHPNQAQAYSRARKWVEWEREAEGLKAAVDPDAERAFRSLYVGFRARGDYRRNSNQIKHSVWYPHQKSSDVNGNRPESNDREVPADNTSKETLKIRWHFEEVNIAALGVEESRTSYNIP